MNRVFISALFVLSCVSPGSIAGMITFSGDLAGVLGGPLVTPDLIAAGQTIERTFDSGIVAGTGSVKGAVEFSNTLEEGLQVGRIVLREFVFTSDRQGEITFGIDILQDFAHPAPSADEFGMLAPAGKFVFPDSSQSGVVLLSATLEDKPFTVGGEQGGDEIIRCAESGESNACGGSALLDVVPALAPISASMSLDMTLTNGEVTGSQIILDLVALRYDALLVPEPNSVVLLGTGLISLLVGYGWRRRSAQPKPA